MLHFFIITTLSLQYLKELIIIADDEFHDGKILGVVV